MMLRFWQITVSDEMLCFLYCYWKQFKPWESHSFFRNHLVFSTMLVNIKVGSLFLILISFLFMSAAWFITFHNLHELGSQHWMLEVKINLFHVLCSDKFMSLSVCRIWRWKASSCSFTFFLCKIMPRDHILLIIIGGVEKTITFIVFTLYVLKLMNIIKW